jgi:glycerol kinase
VRATLEAITFEVRDVFDTIQTPIPVLRVDGGASENPLLMQMQADQLGVPVERPRIVDTTGLGAAFLAGLGTGVWSSQDEIAATWALERRFEPDRGARRAADNAYQQWLKAVERSKHWQERPAR